MASTVLVPPIALIPAYGGIIKNASIQGYGSIRNNVTKICQTGYFGASGLDESPISSLYIEWTSAPESILMVIGDFKSGKVHGNAYKYVSTGSLYCEAKSNDSSIVARRRYVRAAKTKQSCTNGVVDSTTNMGTITLMMNWVNNNLLTAYDIGDVDISGGAYEVDDAVRADSLRLVAPIKNSLTQNIYI